jgi:ubiquinone/menaquinone biosynthesis C-methylase UbiE
MNAPKQASWDPIWEKLFSSQAWGKYPPEHVVRFVARNFYEHPSRKDVRLLDVGCGPGSNTWLMAREGFSVSAIDGSPSAIQKTTDRLAEENCTAELKNGDVVQLPWPDNTFDGAIDNFSLCANRYEAFGQAVSEIWRVLKPGGKVLSASFTTECWGYGMGTEIAPDTFIDAKEGVFKDRGLITLLTEVKVRSLFANFTSVNLEKVSWTLDDMQHLVDCWIMIARKPAA